MSKKAVKLAKALEKKRREMLKAAPVKRTKDVVKDIDVPKLKPLSKK
jgi:hypothetical protein